MISEIGIRGAETSFDYLMVLGYAEEEEGDIPWPAWRAGYGPVEHFGKHAIRVRCKQ